MDKGFSWVRAFCSELFLVCTLYCQSKYIYIRSEHYHLFELHELDDFSFFFSSTIAGATVQYISITKWDVLLAN